MEGPSPLCSHDVKELWSGEAVYGGEDSGRDTTHYCNFREEYWYVANTAALSGWYIQDQGLYYVLNVSASYEISYMMRLLWGFYISQMYSTLC